MAGPGNHAKAVPSQRIVLKRNMCSVRSQQQSNSPAQNKCDRTESDLRVNKANAFSN